MFHVTMISLKKNAVTFIVTMIQAHFRLKECFHDKWYHDDEVNRNITIEILDEVLMLIRMIITCMIIRICVMCCYV